jgi:hypothetical protein
VGLLDLDGLAGGGGEFLGQGLVDVGIEFAGRIVGNVEQRHVCGRRRTNHGETDEGAERRLLRNSLDHWELIARNHSLFKA